VRDVGSTKEGKLTRRRRHFQSSHTAGDASEIAPAGQGERSAGGEEESSDDGSFQENYCEGDKGSARVTGGHYAQQYEGEQRGQHSRDEGDDGAKPQVLKGIDVAEGPL